jgi:exopolysaccharide production protein ExoQ
MNEAYSPHHEVNFLAEGESKSLRNIFSLHFYLLLPMLLFSTHGSVPILMGSNDVISGTGVSTFGTIAGMAIVGGVVIICLGAMQPSWRVIISTFLRQPLIAFPPLLAIASTAWSQEPLGSFRKGSWLLVSTLFAIYLLKALGPRQLVSLLMFVGTVASLLSIFFCVALPSYGLDNSVGANAGSWQGIFPQKNSAAMALVFLLSPVFIPSETSGVRQSRRLMYGFLVVFLIIMSQSRTAWGITLLYAGLMLALRIIGKFPRLQSVLLAALASMLVILGGVVIATHVDAITALMGRDATFSGRTEIWAAVLRSIGKRPFLGYGYNAFWIGFKGEVINVLLAARFSLTHAHNGFLNVCVELGLVGVAGVVLMLLVSLKNAVIAFGPRRSPFVDWYIGLVFLTIGFNLDESFLLGNMDLRWILCLVGCLGLSEAARMTSALTRQVKLSWS